MGTKNVVKFSKDGAELIKKSLAVYISVECTGKPFNDEVTLAMKLYQTFNNMCERYRNDQAERNA